jgi:PAS domain S-box-containing protein
MQEKNLTHKLMIIISCIFVLPAFVLCYIFYEQNVTLSPTHFVLFFLIIALAVIGIILVRYVFDAVSNTADFLKKATEGGERLSLNLHQEAVELNEISSSLNRLIERFEKTTESLNQTKKELHESEEKYGNILENIEEGYYELDLAGNFTFFNEACRRIYGYSREELMGRNASKLADEDNAKKASKYFNEVYTTGKPLTRLDGEMIRKDGSKRNVEASASLIRDITGQSIGFRGIIRDVTEHRQAEEEKRRLEERLQRAEKMELLGALAGGVAHDLNNVMGIVVGFSEMLLMDADTSRSIGPSLVKIMDGARKAAAITQDLLTLARRGVSGREVLNLNKIIADCQQSPEFEKLSSYHPSVEIKSDLDRELLNISGSSVHLGKTLFNLVSNATEAMPKGGIVTIKTANQYLDKPIQGYDEVREGDYVVLSVSDTGEGIPAANLKRIFEPFYTKKVMGRSGTGLGLAVVWGTVKDHNGYINVQSEEGEGSIFTLYFPVTREDISAEAVAIAISEYMGSGESILVVDDVKEQRDLATEMLRKLNYNVTSVSSGEEAVAYLKEHHVDLMVLDMIMDLGMDGLDTYRSILEIHPQQKAIIVSGFSESDRVHAAQALGAGVYVRKPYVIEKLGMAVRAELDRK